MNSRSQPRMWSQSLLDIDAKRRLSDAAKPTVAGKRGGAQSRFEVTWLSDMLTPDRNSFSVIRLVMALAVLVSHAVFLTTGKVELEPLYRWTGYTLGQHGVQVFFILSGILVAQSLFQSRSVRDYAIARGLRIFPALIVCVLLTALALGPWLTELPAWLYLRDSWTAAYIVKTIGLWTGSAELPALFQDNTVPRAVNTSVWTLKYEVLCYAILAAGGFLVLHIKAWRSTAAVLAAVWLVAALAVPAGIAAHDGPKSMLHVLHYFTIFFGTGVLAYAARHYIPIHAAVLIPLGAMFWLAIGTRVAVPAMAVSLGYLALWLATFRFGSLRAFTNRNDYSYATYLYHFPVAQALLLVAPGMHVLPLIGLTHAGAMCKSRSARRWWRLKKSSSATFNAESPPVVSVTKPRASAIYMNCTRSSEITPAARSEASGGSARCWPRYCASSVVWLTRSKTSVVRAASFCAVRSPRARIPASSVRYSWRNARAASKPSSLPRGIHRHGGWLVVRIPTEVR